MYICVLEVAQLLLIPRHVRVCISIYVYIYIYIYICISIYICIYIYTYMYICQKRSDTRGYSYEGMLSEFEQYGVYILRVEFLLKTESGYLRDFLSRFLDTQHRDTLIEKKKPEGSAFFVVSKGRARRKRTYFFDKIGVVFHGVFMEISKQ